MNILGHIENRILRLKDHLRGIMEGMKDLRINDYVKRHNGGIYRNVVF
jgi:hypothetical protein